MGSFTTIVCLALSLAMQAHAAPQSEKCCECCAPGSAFFKGEATVCSVKGVFQRCITRFGVEADCTKVLKTDQTVAEKAFPQCYLQNNQTIPPPTTTTASTTTVAPLTVALTLPPLPTTTTMYVKDSSASSGSGASSASWASIGSGPGDSSSASGSGVRDSFNQGSWATSSGSWASSAASSGSTASGSWGSQLPIWLWIILICLCCCCHGGIGAMMSGKGKPKPKKTKKDAPGSTHLTTDVERGATKMNVNSIFGFKVGDTIEVAPGTPEREVNTVEAFGSIICANPLKNDHPAGTKVVKAAKPAKAPEVEPLLPALPPLMPLATTSQFVPSYSYVPAPQQSYTYAAPATTAYVAAPQQSYSYSAPPTTSYAAAPVAYAQPAYAQPAYGGYAGNVV